MTKFNLLFVILFFILIQGCTSYDKSTPKNIDEAILHLNRECPNNYRVLICNTENDSLLKIIHQYGGKYETILYNWTHPDSLKSRLRKYFEGKDIGNYRNQQEIVLIAFKQYLLGKPFNEKEIIKPYQVKEKKWRKEYKERFHRDSLNGIYIPYDIQDCINQLNIMMPDSFKTNIIKKTEGGFCGEQHFGLGMGLRNNWYLWGGSRLSKYFNDMGILHPDDMSGIILTCYYRYHAGLDFNLQKQVEHYINYWKDALPPSEEFYPKGVTNLEFHYSCGYQLNDSSDYVTIHQQTNSKSDSIWIYSYSYGWNKILKKDLKQLDTAKKENSEKVIKHLFKK